MATKSKYGLKGKDRDSYLELVLAFPLASIKSEEHLEAAREVMDRLLAKGELDHGEEMYLDALSDLVAAYEQSDSRHSNSPKMWSSGFSKGGSLNSEIECSASSAASNSSAARSAVNAPLRRKALTWLLNA